jgi:predicted amidohydrolase
VDSAGEIVATYSKAHLFDVDIADGQFKESNTVEPGNRLVLVNSGPVLNVGLSICYDLRFPPLYSALRAHGAHVLLVPSAFMVRCVLLATPMLYHHHSLVA